MGKLKMYNSNMNKMKHYLCILIGGALAFSACIKENMGACPPDTPGDPEPLETRILFSYDETGVTPVKELGLENAMLYVFDSNNRLVGFREIDNPRLDSVYNNLISLNPGNYSFVVWMNPLSDPYAITPSEIGSTLKSDGRFSLKIPADTLIDSPALPLSMYGQKEEILQAGGNQADGSNEVVIPVYQNTNRINISLSGLQATSNRIRFAITDNNGMYTFDNDFDPSCRFFSYIADATYSSTDHLNVSLTVLQLAGNHPTPVLSIKNLTTGNNIWSYNLIEILNTLYPGNDFKKKHVYDIDIEFKEVNMEVWINGWEIISSNNELTPWQF